MIFSYKKIILRNRDPTTRHRSTENNQKKHSAQNEKNLIRKLASKGWQDKVEKTNSPHKKKTSASISHYDDRPSVEIKFDDDEQRGGE